MTLNHFINQQVALFGRDFIRSLTPTVMATRIFRLLVGSALLLMYADRHKDLNFFYGSWSFSLLPQESWAQAWLESQRPSWFFFVPDQLLPWLHGGYLILIVMYILSWGNRWLTAGTWLIHLYFLLRNPMVWFGADLVANLWLMYSVFFPSGQTSLLKKLLSVFSQLRRPRAASEPRENVTESFGARLGVLLILTHLMIIYFYTGLEKLRGATWWDGTALWYALANSQMVVWDTTGWILQGAYWLIPVLSWLTVCFEIFFPLALFLPKPWPWVFLGFGLLFHTSIGILMALTPFSLLMMAPYVFLASLFKSKKAP